MERQSIFCVICNQPVDLKSAKTDEEGKPVHEECYAATLTLDTALESEAALRNALLDSSPRLRR